MSTKWLFNSIFLFNINFAAPRCFLTMHWPIECIAYEQQMFVSFAYVCFLNYNSRHYSFRVEHTYWEFITSGTYLVAYDICIRFCFAFLVALYKQSLVDTRHSLIQNLSAPSLALTSMNPWCIYNRAPANHNNIQYNAKPVHDSRGVL